MANDPFAKFIHGLPEPKLSDIPAFKPFKVPTKKAAQAKLPAVKKTTRTQLKEIKPVSETIIPEVKLNLPERRKASTSTSSGGVQAASNAQLAKDIIKPTKNTFLMDPESLIQKVDVAIKPSKFARPDLAALQREEAKAAKADAQHATTPKTLAEMFPTVTEKAVRYAAMAWGVDEKYLNSLTVGAIMATYNSGVSAIDFYGALKAKLAPLITQSNIELGNLMEDPDAYKPESEPDTSTETTTSLPGAPKEISQWTPIITEVAKNSGIADSELANFTALVGAIIFGESGGNAGREGDHGMSFGLLQLYTGGGQGDGHTADELKDPYKNLSIGVPYIVSAWKKVMADPNIKNWKDRLYEIMAESGHPSRKGLQDHPEFFNLVYQQLTNYLVGASTENPGTTETMAMDSLPTPFEGDFPITSYFGANDVAERKGAHTGIDYGMPIGTPVKTVLPGKVVSAKPNGGFGLEVLVEVNIGGQKYYLQYGHLSQANVHEGDMIPQGEVVGLSGGATGNPTLDGTSTGAHLHFGVKDPNGQWTDPIKFIRGRSYLVEQTGMTTEEVMAKVGWSEEVLDDMIQKYVNGYDPKPDWRSNMQNLIIQLHHWNTGFTAQPQVRDMGSSDNPMGDEGYKVGASESRNRIVMPGETQVDPGQTFHSEEEIAAISEKFMDLGRRLSPEEEQVFLNTIQFGEEALSNVAQKAWNVYVNKNIQAFAEQGINGVDDDLSKFVDLLPNGMQQSDPNAAVNNDPFMTSHAQELDNTDPLHGLLDKYYEDVLHPTQRVLFGPVMHSMSQLTNDLYGGEGPKDLLSLLTLLPLVNLPASLKKVYDEAQAGNWDTAVSDAIFDAGLGSLIGPALANIPRQMIDGDHPYLPKEGESLSDFNARTAKQWDAEVDPLKIRDVIETMADPLNFTDFKTFAAAYVATEGITPTSGFLGSIAALGPIGKAVARLDAEHFGGKAAEQVDKVLGAATRKSFNAMEALVGQDFQQRLESVLINKYPGMVDGSQKPTFEEIITTIKELARPIDPNEPIDASRHKLSAMINRVIPGGERERTINRQLFGEQVQKAEKSAKKLTKEEDAQAELKASKEFSLRSAPEPGLHPKANHTTSNFNKFKVEDYELVRESAALGGKPLKDKSGNYYRRVPGEGILSDAEIKARTYTLSSKKGKYIPEGAVDDAAMSFDRRLKLGLPTSRTVNGIELPLGSLPDERVSSTFRDPIGHNTLAKNISDAQALRTQDDIVNMLRAGAITEDQAVAAYVRAWKGNIDDGELSALLATRIDDVSGNLVGKITDKVPTGLGTKNAGGITVDGMVRNILERRKKTALIDMIEASGEASVDGLLGMVGKHARDVWRSNNDDLVAIMRQRHMQVAQFGLSLMDKAYINGWRRTLGPLLSASSRTILGFPGYALGNALEDFTQGALQGGGLARTRGNLRRKLEIWFGEDWRNNPNIPYDIKRMMMEPGSLNLGGKTAVALKHDFDVEAPWYKRAIDAFRTGKPELGDATTQAEYINMVAKKGRDELKKNGSDFTMQSAADLMTQVTMSDFWIKKSSKWSHRIKADYALHNYQRQLDRMMRETYHLRSEQYKQAVRNARELLPTNMSTKVRSEVMEMFQAALHADNPEAALERIKTRFGEDQLKARTIQEFMSNPDTWGTVPRNSRNLLWDMVTGPDGHPKDMPLSEFVAIVNGPFRDSVHSELIMQAAHSVKAIKDEFEKLIAQVNVSDMKEEDVVNFIMDLRRIHMSISDIPHYAHTQAAKMYAVMPDSADAIWNTADNQILTQYEQLMTMYKGGISDMQKRMRQFHWTETETAFLSLDQKIADLNMQTWRESARIGKSGKNAGAIRSSRAKLWNDSNKERLKIQEQFANQLNTNDAFTKRINNYIKQSAGDKNKKMVHSWLRMLETTDNWTPAMSEAFIKTRYGGDDMFKEIFRYRDRYDKNLERLRKAAGKKDATPEIQKAAAEYATLLDNWKHNPNYAERVRLEKELDDHFKYTLKMHTKLPKGYKVVEDRATFEAQKAQEVSDIADFVEKSANKERDLGNTIADLDHEVSRLEEEIAAMKRPYGSVTGVRQAKKELKTLGPKPEGQIIPVPKPPEAELKFKNLTDPGREPQPIVPLTEPIAPDIQEFPLGSLTEEEFAAKMADQERIIMESAATLEERMPALRKQLDDTYKRVSSAARQYEQTFNKHADKVVPTGGGVENATKVLEDARNKLRALSRERDRIKSVFHTWSPESAQRLSDIDGQIYAEIDNARAYIDNYAGPQQTVLQPEQQSELERLMSTQGMTVDEMNRLDELTQKVQMPDAQLTRAERKELTALDAKFRKGEAALYAPDMGDIPIEPQGGLLGEAISNQNMVDIDPEHLKDALREYADFIEAEQHLRDTSSKVEELKHMLAQLQEDRKAVGGKITRRPPEERVRITRPWSPESTEAAMSANKQQPVMNYTDTPADSTFTTASGRPIEAATQEEAASTIAKRYAERRYGQLKRDLDDLKSQREKEIGAQGKYTKELEDFARRHDLYTERLAEHQSTPAYKAFKKRQNIRRMQDKANAAGEYRHMFDMADYLHTYGDAIKRNKEWRASLARWGQSHSKWEKELNKWQGLIDKFEMQKEAVINELNSLKEHIRLGHSQLGRESQMNRIRYLNRMRKIDELDQKIAHAKGYSVVDAKGNIITKGHPTASVAESEGIILTHKDLAQSFIPPSQGGKNFAAGFEAELLGKGLPPRPGPNSTIEEKLLWHAKVNMAQDLNKTASEMAWMLTPEVAKGKHVEADSQVDQLLESIRNMDKHPDIRPDTQQQVGEWVDAVKKDVSAIPEWDRQKLRETKQTAIGNLAEDARKAYTQYDNQTVFDYTMQHIFPFWMYETRRFGRLYNNFERHPWTLRTMLNYYNNTDRGYVEIAGKGYYFRPDAGTLWTGGGLLDPRATYRSMPGMLGVGEEVQGAYEKTGLFSPVMDTAISATNAVVNRDVRLMSDSIMSATGIQNPVNSAVMLGQPLPFIDKTVPGGGTVSELATDFRDMLGDNWNTYNVDIWLGDQGYNADEVRAAADLGQKISPVNYPFKEVDARELLKEANASIAARSMGLDMIGAAIYRSPARRKHEEERMKLIMEHFDLTEEEYNQLRKSGGLNDKLDLQPKFKEQLKNIPGGDIWNRNANIAFAPQDERDIRLTVDRFYRSLRQRRAEAKNSQMVDDGKLKMPSSDYTHAKWIEDHKQRQIEMANLPYNMRTDGSNYGSRDITSHGVPITSDEWAEYRARLTSSYSQEQLSPLDTILNDYYKISPMDERFQKIEEIDGRQIKETDWLAYYAAKDRIVNNIPENEPELKQAVLYQISKNKTDTEKEFERAAHAYSLYNKLKKYQNMSDEQGKAYDRDQLELQDLSLKLKHQTGHKLGEIQRWLNRQMELKMKWNGVNTDPSEERTKFLDSPDGRLISTWFFQQESDGPTTVK